MDLSSSLDPDRLERIRDALLSWFRTNGRALPWRNTRDPYAILVSEVMLQQTQVDRVIPYYERFLERFPAVQDLATAPTADVIRIWSGLGYNRRAVNLQRAAQAVVERFGGAFPDSVEQLRDLPGVGAYTAGAVAAFAFERDVAFLDTNMRRVVARLLFAPEGEGTSTTEKKLLAAAHQLVPPGQGWEWNQALIEFGALQCTARTPACVVCPLQRECLAYPTIHSEITMRRSRSKQGSAAPFETTPRFYRGRIVEILRALPESEQRGVPLAELGTAVRADFSDDDLPWLIDLVEGLQRDGLAMVAEETPAYDAGNASRPAGRLVRLP